MTRSGRTQLGWLTFFAISSGGGRKSTVSALKGLFWFVAFTLCCFAVGGLLMFLHI